MTFNLLGNLIRVIAYILISGFCICVARYARYRVMLFLTAIAAHMLASAFIAWDTRFNTAPQRGYLTWTALAMVAAGVWVLAEQMNNKKGRH